MHTRLRTARGRKLSSSRWLERQLNDEYVEAARRDGYRSRAAYKLIEMDEKFGFFRRGACVVDLGCAPGSWSQVAARRVGREGVVVGVDLAETDALADVKLLTLDFTDPDAPARIAAAAGRAADVVLSDMAAPATGHRATDHLRILALAEAAAAFAVEVSAPSAAFCAKVYQGGASGDLLDFLKSRFARVRHVKPAASRKESAELYLVAQGFKG